MSETIHPKDQVECAAWHRDDELERLDTEFSSTRWKFYPKEVALAVYFGMDLTQFRRRVKEPERRKAKEFVLEYINGEYRIVKQIAAPIANIEPHKFNAIEILPTASVWYINPEQPISPGAEMAKDPNFEKVKKDCYDALEYFLTKARKKVMAYIDALERGCLLGQSFGPGVHLASKAEDIETIKEFESRVLYLEEENEKSTTTMATQTLTMDRIYLRRLLNALTRYTCQKVESGKEMDTPGLIKTIEI